VLCQLSYVSGVAENGQNHMVTVGLGSVKRGVGWQRGRGAEGQRGRGAEGQRGRGAEGQSEVA
jgi:hypothetical protein